jgi:trans-aconitate 2-methyltransferase
MTQNTYWDAETYDRIGTPMRGWAQQVIEDLHLRGDETVLDAGCGSGSVTLDLRARLPRGTIYAVDASAEMIEQLRRRLATDGVTGVVPIHASLTDFSLPEPVDRVFSNAVFHWIPDDAALFSSLYHALRGASGRLPRLEALPYRRGGDGGARARRLAERQGAPVGRAGAVRLAG